MSWADFAPGVRERRLMYVENGCEVVRCHTFPTLRPQTVGQHSAQVAWWCEELTDGHASANLIMAALAHDLPEHIFGDIPAPAKLAMPEEAKAALAAAEDDSMAHCGLPRYHLRLSVCEQLMLKIADSLEFYAYVLRELRLGNRHPTLILCAERGGSYVQKHIFALRAKEGGKEQGNKVAHRADQLYSTVNNQIQELLA